MEARNAVINNGTVTGLCGKCLSARDVALATDSTLGDRRVISQSQYDENVAAGMMVMNFVLSKHSNAGIECPGSGLHPEELFNA